MLVILDSTVLVANRFLQGNDRGMFGANTDGAAAGRRTAGRLHPRSASRRSCDGGILTAMNGRQAREHFENFTHSIAAARELLARAQESGSLIEGLVLYAALVDGLLRMLVAHATAEREDVAAHLDLRHFFHDAERWRNERQVYRGALECGVLSEQERTELDDLYSFRNVVIHRFVISGVTYDEIVSRLDAYEMIYGRLFARLTTIEQPGPPISSEQESAIRVRIARKLGEPGASG